MTKFSSTFFAVFAPLSLLWACGSSTDGDSLSTGASTGSGGALALTGGAAVIGGEGSDPSGGRTTGSTTGGSAMTTGGTLTVELCGDAGCTCSNGIDDDMDGLV